MSFYARRNFHMYLCPIIINSKKDLARDLYQSTSWRRFDRQIVDQN